LLARQQQQEYELDRERGEKSRERERARGQGKASHKHKDGNSGREYEMTGVEKEREDGEMGQRKGAVADILSLGTNTGQTVSDPSSSSTSSDEVLSD